MDTILYQIEHRFRLQLKSIEELANFDRFVLDFCIDHIQILNENLRNGPFEIKNPAYLAENALKAIQNVRDHDTMRNKYESIFNSCLVLQVSYFTSTLHDIFRQAFPILVRANKLPEIKEELKFTIKELDDLSFDLMDNLGEIIVKKKDISLQDMQSIKRAFKTYFGVDIGSDSNVHTIIFAQASRHAIVHALGKADDKFVRQISEAKLRTLKLNITDNQQLKFTPAELIIVKNAMTEFVAALNKKIISLIDPF